MTSMSPDFFNCWAAAGKHLDRQLEGGLAAWLKSSPYPPFLEHLSFRFGNQLFFVRVEDVDGQIVGPSSVNGLKYVARENEGFACILPMRYTPGIGWTAAQPGWGLLDVVSGEPVNPVLCATDEVVEMTDWELQDMAIQVVREYLETEGYELMSWQGNPKVDPGIWFVGDTGGPEWVVVRVARYPSNKAQRPDNWRSIAEGCSKMSSVGHFASVGLVTAQQPEGGEISSSLPRGQGMMVSFGGLE